MKNFPLTDLQQAYWFGEQDIFTLNTLACLCRSFFVEKLDIRKLERILLTMIKAHPMLRARFCTDSTQWIAPSPAEFELAVVDMRSYELGEDDLRARQKVLLLQKLPMLEQGLNVVCAIYQSKEGYYIYFLFRLIAFDGMSVRIFLRELSERYANEVHHATLGIPVFETYVERRKVFQESEEYRHSLRYWQDRLETLPSAPELPLVNYDKLPQRSMFSRRKAVLDKAHTARLTQQARKCGVSLTILLCTAYADILRLWSKNASFTLNMLISHRPQEFAEVLGNFSDTMLLEVAETPGSIAKRAVALRRQLGRDMEHAQVSGIEVIRAIRGSVDGLPTMPVVFASLLGSEGKTPRAMPEDIGWQPREGFLHTPQVLLDHQVSIQSEQLVLNWDTVDSAFMPNIPEEMFVAYQAHLKAIADAELLLDGLVMPVVPEKFLSSRRVANETERALPKDRLQEYFRSACERFPNSSAIIASDQVISYQALWGLTTRLAAKLRNHGVGRNDLVAICAGKGWRQVAAVVSVIQAGAAYLPISIELPDARKSYLLQQKGLKVLLTEECHANDFPVPDGVLLLTLEECLPLDVSLEAVELEPIQNAEDLAYVIFTSGSTGQPKGVAIDHRGAVNTLQDVIDRFGLTSTDRVIGISAFNFDLSVYDIFATLGTGAALVLPQRNFAPDPDGWAKCVKMHEVTVWNTVPALMEMVLESLGPRSTELMSSLRLVMLSGDWIPLSLPHRIKQAAPGSTVISLGGATEASIWSNYFVVNQVDPNWKSIPYGWPLSNQFLHILDKNMRPAPNWVAGELYIGGAGLAKEYYQDAERTAASFITHPESGERLYRTGDLGRYDASGQIEFLGRNDGQVKIRGYRIELGEIESVLERCHGVRTGGAVVRSVAQGDKQLVAFVVLDRNQGDGNIARVSDQLGRALPDYMVPQNIVELDRMPVTANGKIDRKRLLEIADSLDFSARKKTSPRNETERKLAAIWCRLLKLDSMGIEDNFFELGGSSLTAVQLLRMIEDEFEKKLSLASLFRFGTIALQSTLLSEVVESRQRNPMNEPLVKIRKGNRGILALVHPVGGNVLCYRNLIELVPYQMTVVGLQSPGNGHSRTVQDLAASYVEVLIPLLDDGNKDELQILGWSMGGVVGYELTRQLEYKGIHVASLTMIDSWMGRQQGRKEAVLEGFPLLKNFVKDFLMGAGLPAGFSDIEALPSEEARVAAALESLKRASSVAEYFTVTDFLRLLGEYKQNFNALIGYIPGIVRAPTHQFRASRSSEFPFLEPFAQGDENGIACASISIMNEDHFSIVAGTALRKIAADIFDSENDSCVLEANEIF